jgi:hypothetical protein
VGAFVVKSIEDRTVCSTKGLNDKHAERDPLEMVAVNRFELKINVFPPTFND